MTRIRPYFIGVLAILSLFVSPLAACACSHHEAPKAETSCHKHSEPQASPETGESSIKLSSRESCVCAQISPKELAKSENVKLRKHEIARSSVLLSLETIFTPDLNIAAGAADPLTASSTVRRYKPSRAPPRL